MSELTAVILAGGKGTRMKSTTPKILHKIANLEMVLHVIRAARNAGCNDVVVVVPEDSALIKKTISAFDKQVKFVTQEPQLGTGHALMCAAPELEGRNRKFVVLYGDSPLVTSETIKEAASKSSAGTFTLVAFKPSNPFGYGRMIEKNGYIQRIIEEADATAEQKKINLCYSGIMCGYSSDILPLLKGIKPSAKKGEYYLTDLAEIGLKKGIKANYTVVNESEVLGINDRAQLAEAEHVMQNRFRLKFLKSGVTLLDPSSVYFSYDTEIENDVTIFQNVVFGPGVKILSGTEIKAFCHIENAVVGSNCIIGPYARLRPGTNIADDVHIGNFVEIKKSSIGKGSKANHLTYIGDSTVGEKANIGAGTITCNYDGYSKFETIIGDGAFIGSNTALVAPVKVGNGAIIGASTTVTKDVPDDALALSRSEQQVKPGWAYVFRKKNEH